MKVALIIVLTALCLLICGCSLLSGLWTAPSRSSEAGTPTPPASQPPVAPPTRPFPVAWAIAIAVIGGGTIALFIFKSPSLVDYAIALTVGAEWTIVGTELSKMVWDAKDSVAFAFVLLIVLLTAWKLGRKWFLKR